MDRNRHRWLFNGHGRLSLSERGCFQAKTVIRRMVAGLLALGLCTGAFAGSPLLDCFRPVPVQAAGSDYSQYSNTKKSWYVKRNGDHQPSVGASTAKELARYQAYYYDDQTKDKVIYLTFDCGYENGYTEKLLDVLKKHDVKAVFFVTKHFVQSQPQLCRRMKEEGHLVGNHTMSHPSLPDRSVEQIKNEIRGLEDVFEEKTGYQLDKFLRPPMGEYSNRVLKIAQDLGYQTVFWSIAYYDYDVDHQPGKQYVIDHFQKYHHKGAIALIHNISSSNAAALNTVLTDLEKKGYQCMRIDAFGQQTDIRVAAPQWEDILCYRDKTSALCMKLQFFTKAKKNEAGPDGFEIYRKEKGGKYQLIATKKANKNSAYIYRDRDVTEGKTYYYKVRAYTYKYGKKYVAYMPSGKKKTAVVRPKK